MTPVVDQIVESIAHAAVDVDRWSDVLSEIKRTFSGTKIVMHSEDSSSSCNIGLIYNGTDDTLMRDYTVHYASINPWAKTFLRMPTMHPALTDEVHPSATFEKSEFYSDFVRPEGEFEHAAGVKIFHESSRLTMLSVHYGDRLASRYNTVLKRTLQSLTPHLRIALEVNRRISDPGVVVKSIADIVHSSRSAMCLLDAGAKLLLANELFLDELTKNGLFVAGGDDKVLPRDRALRAAFDQLVRRATARRMDKSAAPTDPFEMTFGADGPAPARVAILGITPHGRAGVPWLSNLRAYALVTVDRAPVPTSLTPSALVSRHGLTRAEARLAVGLSTGLTLSECADRSVITYETARTYLRNIFAKTDTHRQGQLVAMLLNGERKRGG